MATIIERCSACREGCEDFLSQLDDSPESRVGAAATLRCVAFLIVIADTLEADAECPWSVIDAAIELARELPDDDAGCAEACRAAADTLSEWMDGGYEHA